MAQDVYCWYQVNKDGKAANYCAGVKKEYAQFCMAHGGGMRREGDTLHMYAPGLKDESFKEFVDTLGKGPDIGDEGRFNQWLETAVADGRSFPSQKPSVKSLVGADLVSVDQVVSVNSKQALVFGVPEREGLERVPQWLLADWDVDQARMDAGMGPRLHLDASDPEGRAYHLDELRSTLDEGGYEKAVFDAQNSRVVFLPSLLKPDAQVVVKKLDGNTVEKKSVKEVFAGFRSQDWEQLVSQDRYVSAVFTDPLEPTVMRVCFSAEAGSPTVGCGSYDFGKSQGNLSDNVVFDRFKDAFTAAGWVTEEPAGVRLSGGFTIPRDESNPADTVYILGRDSDYYVGIGWGSQQLTYMSTQTPTPASLPAPQITSGQVYSPGDKSGQISLTPQDLPEGTVLQVMQFVPGHPDDGDTYYYGTHTFDLTNLPTPPDKVDTDSQREYRLSYIHPDPDGETISSPEKTLTYHCTIYPFHISHTCTTQIH